MAKTNITHEEQLARLIRMHGRETKAGGYRLSVREMEIIIDGRIAEEYEDLEKPAPCQIDYVAVDSASTTPWFNMFTAFTTGYPLMSNDKYAASAMGSKVLKRLVDDLTGKYGKTTSDAKRVKELNRAEWVKAVEKHDRRLFLRELPEYNGCWLEHAIDCVYCCYEKRDVIKNGLTLDMVEKLIINAIDKTAAFFIRVQFPTNESLLDSSYLASQDGERWARWNHIIPLVCEKVDGLITSTEVVSLMSKKPAAVLKDGRLPGNPLKPVKKLPAPSKVVRAHRDYPDMGSHPNWDKASWDARINHSKRMEKKFEALTKKMGHPRFEIVLDKSLTDYYRKQVMGLAWKFFYNPDSENKPSKPEHVRVYNGSTETSLPSIGSVVIDHFDDDKTPYLLGDIINLASSKNSDDSEFFTRVKSSAGKDIIVQFDFIRNGRLRDSDWSNDPYSRMAKLQYANDAELLNLINKFKMPVSERTGMQYMLHTHHARITVSALKALWKQFDSEFDADEQKMHDREVLRFDHEAFALKVHKGGLKDEDFKKIPRKYERTRIPFLKMMCRVNYGRYRNEWELLRGMSKQELDKGHKAWWTDIRSQVLQDAMRVKRVDSLNYSLLEKHKEIIPCKFSEVGHFYLTPAKLLNADEQKTAEKVRLVVDALIHKE